MRSTNVVLFGDGLGVRKFSFVLVLMLMMVMAGRLELPNQNGQAKPGEQCTGELDAVMRVKLDFGEEIARCNAQETSGGKRQRCAEERTGLRSRLAKAEKKQEHSNRDGQREDAVDDMTGVLRPPVCRHQGADGHRVEWFVEQDDEERTEAFQDSFLAARFGLNTRRQRQPVQQ